MNATYSKKDILVESSILFDTNEGRIFQAKGQLFVKAGTQKIALNTLTKYLRKSGYRNKRKNPLSFHYRPSLSEALSGKKLRHTIDFVIEKADKESFCFNADLQCKIGTKVILPADKDTYELILKNLVCGFGAKKCASKLDQKWHKKARMRLSLAQGFGFIVSGGVFWAGSKFENILSRFFVEKDWVPGFLFDGMKPIDSIMMKFYFSAGFLFVIAQLLKIDTGRRQRAENKYLENPNGSRTFNIMLFFLQDIFQKIFITLAIILFAIPTFIVLDEMIKGMI